MWGARSSLLVGFVVGIAATCIGILVGPGLGLLRQASSTTRCPWSPTSSCCIPGLPLLVILAAFLPPGIGHGDPRPDVTGWAGSARVLRSQALSIRGKDFVAAAIVTGERARRIMFREILPEHGLDRDDHAARVA